jgi:hypothetical protein
MEDPIAAGSPLENTPPSRPATIKWLVALSWFRIAIFVMVFVLALTFLSPFHSAKLEQFREGFLVRGGFAPESYGPRDAGYLAGGGFLTALLSILMLWSIRRRRLVPLRVAAVVNGLLSLGQPLTVPLALLTALLTFQNSTTRFCGGNAPKRQPSPPRLGNRD